MKKQPIKRTTKNLLKILKGEIIALRRMQDDYSKSGNYELAERRKIQRWELENVVEMLESQEKFNSNYDLWVEDDAK